MHTVRRHLTGKEIKAWKAKLPTVSQLMKWLCCAPGSSWSPYAVCAHGERPFTSYEDDSELSIFSSHLLLRGLWEDTLHLSKRGQCD